ncbi:hypothetical protein JTE90_003935 [Oedothorax gibbosus]|uniref:Uncharacterized protein n=1 Tax=Oedothorax gibbosus TaxID=931172 RepID=A0AAV6UYD1_9ARAC|nr:hypothetical protein JTE90_003935 [Oedothorax gibbosus]
MYNFFFTPNSNIFSLSNSCPKLPLFNKPSSIHPNTIIKEPKTETFHLYPPGWKFHAGLKLFNRGASLKRTTKAEEYFARPFCATFRRGVTAGAPPSDEFALQFHAYLMFSLWWNWKFFPFVLL